MKKTFVPSLAGQTTSVRLANGLTAYIIPKHDSPIVYIQAFVRTGSIHEEEFSGCGLSHFLEHMLFMGSSRYPGNSASDKVTSLGGYFNACTSKDYTSYITFLPSKYVAEGVDILDDMLRNPLFPAEKFESEKNVILRESSMYEDSADSKLDDLLAEALFRSHPARLPIIGYPEKIRSVTRNMMISYYQRRYSPHRCFYVICGDVDAGEVSRIIEEKCSSWPMGDLREIVFRQERSISSFHRREFTFPDPMSRIGTGWLLPALTEKDHAAARCFLNLLAQSGNSRLDRSLVMEKELAFDVYAGAEKNDGFANATLFVTGKYENRMRISDEIHRVTTLLADSGPLEEELQGAVTRLRAGHCKLFLTAENIASLAGSSILHTGGLENIDAYMRRFEELTVEDVKEAGRKYFGRESACEVQLLPAEKHCRKSVACKKEKGNFKTSQFRTGKNFRAVFLEDRENSFINMRLLLPCGIYCGKGKSAAGPLLADLLPTGTAKYTEEEISALLSDQAISLSFQAGNATLSITMSALREKWDMAVKVLHSILHEPLFDKKKLERERLSLLEEYRSNLTNPEYLSFERFFSEMAGEPHAPLQQEHEKSITSLTAAELKKIFENVCLQPEKAVIGLSGALTEKEAKKWASFLLDDLKIAAKPLKEIPRKKYTPGVRNISLELNKSQAVFLTGFPCCTVCDKDLYALEILKEATGSMSSRLFDTVRNQNGLAYYTGIKIMSYATAGCLVYYAGTEKKSLKKLEGLFQEEICRIREEGLTIREIEEAKKWVLFRDAVKKQSPGRFIGEMVEEEFFGGSFLEPLKKASGIEELTGEKINAVLKKYLSSPVRLSLTIAPGEKKKGKEKKPLKEKK